MPEGQHLVEGDPHWSRRRTPLREQQQQKEYDELAITSLLCLSCATEKGKVEPEKNGVVREGVLNIYFTCHYPGSFSNKFKSVWPVTIFGQ